MGYSGDLTKITNKVILLKARKAEESMSNEASGYSLWLVPEWKSVAHIAFQQVIRELAKEYCMPNFVPHVTLLGGVQGDEKTILKETQELAALIAPYEIELEDIGSNGTYFQNLFLKVRSTKSVMNANSLAQQFFQVDAGDYFPHLSLAYGDCPPERVAVLRRHVSVRYPKLAEIPFWATGVELWSTDGEVKDWCKIAKLPFSA
jgi:2'-5' RNA ligase